MGFTHVGNHRSKNVRHYAQGDINFILNMEPAARPPTSARRTALGQRDGLPGRGREEALAAGGRARRDPVESPRGRGELDIPAIEGIGGSYLYLVDRYGARAHLRRRFRAGRRAPAATPTASACTRSTTSPTMWTAAGWTIGRDFYERIFNFRQIRYFDIEGQQTALLSRAMTAPDDKIRIPLNESQDEHSQIATARVCTLGEIRFWRKGYLGEAIDDRIER